MSRQILICLCIGGLCCIAVEGRADDLAQPGTRWVGSFKIADPKGKGKKKRIELRSKEAVMIILTRSGEDFTAELHRDKGKRKVKVGGTINKNGVADFRVTERLKGATADDIVDNARHHGRFKDDEYNGKFVIPGNDLRGGEYNLKLEKPVK